MKKIKMLAGSLFVAGLLVGCGSDMAENEESEERNNDAAKEKTEEIMEENKEKEKEEQSEDQKKEEDTNGNEEEKNDNVEETEAGIFTLIKEIEKEKTITSGPMELTITGVDIYNVETKQMFREMMDVTDEELVGVTIYMTSTNASEKDVDFYPDQSTLVLNTGEQVDSELFLSEGELGGTYYGKVVQEGNVRFLLNKSEVDEIEWMKLIIGAPHDAESYESVGEEIREEITIE